MIKTARPLGSSSPRRPGARLIDDGADFTVFSRNGESVDVCLFDAVGDREISRWRLSGRDDDYHHGFIPGLKSGARYGLRVDGPNDPARGHRFDPFKLLVDPYATLIDRPFQWRPELAAARKREIDTAAFVPRAIIEAQSPTLPVAPGDSAPSVIYEVAVKAFTKSHPDVPTTLRGTLGGLAHPKVIEHLAKLGVSHIELMPITAYMSERHLVDLGLENAWGYNPALFTALDPRLAPNGFDDLSRVVQTLREAGIATLLDVVFNHSAESDICGPTINLRGLDNTVYYRHDDSHPTQLINDTGCGNTLACDRPVVVDMIVSSLKTLVERAGIDGFRFDLAVTLARGEGGFPTPHPLFVAMDSEPALKGRALIAEPWDIGPGGYRLGAFPRRWFEWNDKYRDGARRFWRGDHGAVGDFATRIAGSADIFRSSRENPSASVNFVAAHDGFALRDTLSHNRKHNEPNGEDNRDGTNDNMSWNNGVEGETSDTAIIDARRQDARALFASLFLSRGTIMYTAGDEFGRTQKGNNNAYAQDNDTTWLDWTGADLDLARFVADLAALRRALLSLNEDRFLSGEPHNGSRWPDVVWTNANGDTMSSGDWSNSDVLCMTLSTSAGINQAGRIYIVFNRSHASVNAKLPTNDEGRGWSLALNSAEGYANVGGSSLPKCDRTYLVPPRACVGFAEVAPSN